ERQRLLVRHGRSLIEIGRGLREPEREWLHRVLGAWAAGLDRPASPPPPPFQPPRDPVLPPVPVPPATSWIAVEQPAPARLRLPWLPYPGRVIWARGRALLILLGISALWLVFLVPFGGVWLAIVGQFLFGGGAARGSRSPRWRQSSASSSMCWSC